MLQYCQFDHLIFNILEEPVPPCILNSTYIFTYLSSFYNCIDLPEVGNMIHRPNIIISFITSGFSQNNYLIC